MEVIVIVGTAAVTVACAAICDDLGHIADSFGSTVDSAFRGVTGLFSKNSTPHYESRDFRPFRDDWIRGQRGGVERYKEQWVGKGNAGKWDLKVDKKTGTVVVVPRQKGKPGLVETGQTEEEAHEEIMQGSN